MYDYMKCLVNEVLEVNNFSRELISCFEEAEHFNSLYSFFAEQAKSSYSREELENFEFPSYSIFYDMEQDEGMTEIFRELLDDIY